MNGTMTTGHFLGEGRGDIASLSPLSECGVRSAALGGASDRGGSVAGSKDVSQPVPGMSSQKQPPVADEAALLSELDEIENLITEQERRRTVLQQDTQQM